ncbi:carbonic anhydrase 12 isoform X1 [Gadus chalcogrammus]|uniref:carbonic anhydrase 12 isoform X1 n=2 Tax=Gadus chalcogrammus TaxID=1042646 RepID=UPI0024C4E0CB|nr:carbonic anhydrase 12 isoform X1 [Gadus chalcogrammus]
MQVRSFTLAAVLQVTLFGVLHADKWTYNGPEGEHHWSRHYPFCGGAFQSPIDIQTDLLRFDPTLRPIELHDYNLSANEHLTLGNNGHSVQLSLPSRMFLSSLPHRYSAAQLHFHWGSTSTPTGSEHLVNGKRFAAEMHIVHFNSDKYANVSMAVDKSDGLAVLGVLVEVGEFNPAFDQFLKFINGIKYRNQRVKVPGFNIRSLLPARLDEYYRYDGSLTTPPCYPSVLWTLFRSPIQISPKQFLSLASAVYSSRAQESNSVPMNGNYRRPQLPDHRVVLVSFQEGRGLHGIQTVTSPLVRKQIIQQLLVGDLADLADEGLYKLLPSGPEKRLVADKKRKAFNNQHGPRTQHTNPKKQLLHPPPPPSKKSRSHNHLGGGMGLTEEALCYVSLEHQVLHQARQSHTEAQVVHTLRDLVFPDLNLRSYLGCKSELDFSTIRHIVRGRPTDEVLELDGSLRRASVGVMKKFPSFASKQGVPATKYEGVSNVAGQAKTQPQGFPHPWLLPMEWED